ncbi:MAG: hypothetical protein CFE23_13250 [Flavobacterium sp. BFFFF1]|uniref:DUF1697 domain-containing protein n=1 Tax=Flavobacterium sp. BFFFF1 TaxID=2015557 RepID=UPI000BD37716|nr:DUF1697 domain-containing protein [Flavobacterium sp. BFFFF1]OYU79647.1 MAG: hypothetical protein CFE23_13250 [Flavobacterium sp. BFFFF1]
MQVYVALLRGINVSGQRLIKMELLRKALETLEFQRIQTYIQSGNVIFQSGQTDIPTLESNIAALIQEQFGFDVTVIVITPKSLAFVVANNPINMAMIADPAQPYVAFLSEQPTIENITLLAGIDFGHDKLVVAEKFIYLTFKNGAGKTKLTNAVIESRLKVKATSRNWKTIHKLVEIVEDNAYYSHH